MNVFIEKLKHYADLVKFEHTLFALPFALSAMLLASGQSWPSLQAVLWVIVAMVGGRTYAMGLNRIIDKDIDGKNPRTAGRAIPAGRVKLAEAWGITVLSFLLLLFAVLQLPPLCLKLLPIALIALSGYSYVKRFSNLAHLVLGFCLGCSAIGGWVAVTGQLPLSAIVFGFAVMVWVAGFDLIYACQDVAFDRGAGLFSIPASWGVGQGLFISKLCHALTVLCLSWVGYSLHLGWPYALAVLLVGAMLFYEHTLVSETDLSKVDEAFFNVNGAISLAVFLLVCLDKWISIS